jgi:LacI family transcriptional regulator
MLLGGILTCSKHGYRMMVELIDTHSDHVERELSAAISALQPDGVVLTPPHSENRLITELLAERGIPFARIGSNTPGPGIALTMGDEGAGHLATSRLIELGHRRIGMIAGPAQYSLSGWRIEGWKRALAEYGLPVEGLLETGDFGYESGTRAARALLDRDRGLSVPRDLSLISFDNTPIVRFTNPPLTAIDQPIAETVSRAVEQLIAREPADDGDPVIEVAAALVERSSTAPAPGTA